MRPDDNAPLRRTEHWQDDHGRAKDLGMVWTLRKGMQTATCILQGHPIGTEARVLLDGDVQRTEAFRETKEMIDATAAWRAAFEAKGWDAGDAT